MDIATRRSLERTAERLLDLAHFILDGLDRYDAAIQDLEEPAEDLEEPVEENFVAAMD